MYVLYEYEYLYSDLYFCHICKNVIEYKYCVVPINCFKKVFCHKKCLVNLMKYNLDNLYNV